MALRIRRGTNAERQTITFAEGELVYTTDTKELYLGDGTTPGGILASNNGPSSISQLVNNLDLNSFEINGVGNIDINGTVTASVVSGSLFVGDGSGLTNLPQSEGIVEGSNYRINIVGNDSSVMVNTDTNTFIGNFVGDGSGLFNLPQSEGIVEGSNYRINIVGDDSTLLVDTINNRVYAFQLDTDQVNTTSIHTLKRAGTNGKATYNIEGLEGNAELSLTAHRTGVAAGSGYSNSILLGVTGSDGAKNTTALYAEENILYLGQDGTGGLVTEAKYITYDSTSGIGKLGIGTYTPSEVLDVAGNAVIRGNLELDTGSLVLDFTQSISTILAPVAGQFIYDNDSTLISFYDGFGWFTLPKTGELGTTDFAGPIILGATTSLERDEFGADSTAVSGAILYNSTDDRFQFFQAGSWVNLINNGGSIGQLLAWNGTEWAAVDPEITVGTIENANTLNGFSGSYYLDYNNLTNTPTTLAGYGITDAATSAQGLLANTALQPADVGAFTFTGSVLDTGDSGAISIVPATVFNSDVTVENDLVVTNKITVDTLEVNNLITTPSAGTPEISSDGAILLTAATRVEIGSSPLKMASFTTTERNLLSAQNGDIIYNTTDNKFQGYENGAWVNLV